MGINRDENISTNAAGTRMEEDTFRETDLKTQSDMELEGSVVMSGRVPGEIAVDNTVKMTMDRKGKEIPRSGKGKERARSASGVPSEVTAFPFRHLSMHRRTASRTSLMNGLSAKGGEKGAVQSRLSDMEGALSLDAMMEHKRKRDETTMKPKTCDIHGLEHLVQPVLLPYYEFGAYIPAVQEGLKLCCDHVMNSMLVTNAFPDVYAIDEMVEEAVTFANAHSKAKHGNRCIMLDLDAYPGEELLLRRHVMDVQKRALEQAERVLPEVWATLFDLMDVKYEGEDLQAKALEQRLFKEGLDLALSNASFIYRDFNPLKGTQQLSRPFQSKLVIEVMAGLAYQPGGVASKFEEVYTRPPLPLIALSCWAIDQVLSCSYTGKYVEKEVKQDMDESNSIYEGFLLALDNVDEQDPWSFEKMLNSIGTECLWSPLRTATQESYDQIEEAA
ncbi:hypothetical protein CALCODRAFT_479920 [Calocera cornea HHB12733]|uniref:DUF6532 domain-containing protein n=1 Tax=Calocera cornea HHB12733 TaxID=1353952 RepID=A0A165J631_9BASI|nr:hypothetical protein CALCODRAFT_479920 [Calocera cornea HHB12733]